MHVPVTDPSMRQFVLVLPWTEFSNMKKTKKRSLNLNVYRNLYFRELAAQKNNFHDRARVLLKHLPPLGSVWLHYEIFPGHKGRVDTMNVGSIVDKFFSDSLTENGIIEDDDYTRVVFNSFCFGSVVKGESYVQVTITELEPRKQRMRVLLDDADIRKALEAYVEQQGIPGATGVEISIDANNLTLTAEVLFGGSGSTVSVEEGDETPKPKSRGGRPAGSKNKPKEETKHVESSSADDSVSGADGNGEATGQPEDDEDDFFKPKKGAGAKKPNPFEDSPEESSKGDDEADSGEGGEVGEREEDSRGSEDPEPEVKAKKGSIFDNDD